MSEMRGGLPTKFTFGRGYLSFDCPRLVVVRDVDSIWSLGFDLNLLPVLYLVTDEALQALAYM